MLKDSRSLMGNLNLIFSCFFKYSPRLFGFGDFLYFFAWVLDKNLFYFCIPAEWTLFESTKDTTNNFVFFLMIFTNCHNWSMSEADVTGWVAILLV